MSKKDSDVDEKQPPASVFVTRAIKKKSIDKDKKIKRDKSDSEKSGKELNTKKNCLDDSLVYAKGAFLAIRNTDDGFFLCRVKRNIYKGDEEISIRWLTQHQIEKDIYIYIRL